MQYGKKECKDTSDQQDRNRHAQTMHHRNESSWRKNNISDLFGDLFGKDQKLYAQRAKEMCSAELRDCAGKTVILKALELQI